jgi:sulfane dehydrogenase subunit SoxC
MEGRVPMVQMRTGSTVPGYKVKPEQLTEPLTPVDALFVVRHMGTPEVAAETWALTIDGMVERPLRLTLEDLQRREKRVLEAVLKCAGSPRQPTIPTRQVANVCWGGVDLAELLAEAGIGAGSTHVWAYGPDHGSYAGEAQDYYLKDIPMTRLAEGDVLVAYELNGEPLDVDHGFPARLVVPGYYGANSVKWLSQLRLADKRAESLFTTRYYNDPVPGLDATRPVWEIAPESILVAPAANSTLPRGQFTIWGWAWADAAIRTVEISTDGGGTWHAAEVEPPSGRRWQRFSYTWSAHTTGSHTVMCRATDVRGETQPLDGARNAVHMVAVRVE